MKIFLSVLIVMFSTSVFSSDSTRKRDGSLKTKIAVTELVEKRNG